MTFEETLASLLAMIGERITVATSGEGGDPPLALTASGTLANGTELAPKLDGDSDEGVYFCFAEDHSSGFILSRDQFRDADAQGRTLCISLGRVVIWIEPETR